MPPVAKTLHNIGVALEVLKPIQSPKATKDEPQDIGDLVAMFPTVRPPDLDSRNMTKDQAREAAEKLLFGQPVQVWK